jgi:hypothetical protein
MARSVLIEEKDNFNGVLCGYYRAYSAFCVVHMGCFSLSLQPHTRHRVCENPENWMKEDCSLYGIAV